MPNKETMESEGKVITPTIENLVLTQNFHKYLLSVQKFFFFFVTFAQRCGFRSAFIFVIKV